MVGGNGFVSLAEATVASSLAAVLVGSMPLWAALFAGLWGAWPTGREWLGLGLGALGVVLLNLEADEKGVVTIPLDELKGKQHVQIVAVDPTSTALRTVALPEQKPETLDLRLVSALDVDQHYTQQKRISVVSAKGKFELPDISTSRFEAYDSLARVYALYATLSSDPTLLEFGFVLGWPKLEDAKKRELLVKPGTTLPE